MRKKVQEPGFVESELKRLIENAIFTVNIENNSNLLLLDTLLE